MTETTPTRGTVADLGTGDTLLRLGSVGFPTLVDPDAPAVLVADVQPPHPDDDRGDLHTIATSRGDLLASQDSPVLYSRTATVGPDTILLISRRPALHTDLTRLGINVQRRAPIDDSATAHRVTPEEWNTAPLIVIDGYLAATTLTALWERGDLRDRDQIVMVCNDPDDQRVYYRRRLAHGRALFVLPYDSAALTDLFRAAVAADTDRDPYVGILTPTFTQDTPGQPGD